MNENQIKYTTDVLFKLVLKFQKLLPMDTDDKWKVLVDFAEEECKKAKMDKNFQGAILDQLEIFERMYKKDGYK